MKKDKERRRKVERELVTQVLDADAFDKLRTRIDELRRENDGLKSENAKLQELLEESVKTALDFGEGTFPATTLREASERIGNGGKEKPYFDLVDTLERTLDELVEDCLNLADPTTGSLELSADEICSELRTRLAKLNKANRELQAKLKDK